MNIWIVTESVRQGMEHVLPMSSVAPTADASHPIGSVTMTTTVEIILMNSTAHMTPVARHSSRVTMAVVSRRHGSVTMMMTAMIILMRKTAGILHVDQINLHAPTDAAFQNVGFAILTTIAVMALMNKDVRQHQSQQHHLCPAIPLSSLATMADVFLSIGNVTEIKTVVTDPTSRAAVPHTERAPQHSSFVQVDYASLVHGNVMGIMTVGIALMNKAVPTLQLVLPLLRHLGPDLPNAEFGNGSATIHTVFTSGMSVMVLMIVETIQMNGSVVQLGPLRIQQHHHLGRAISGNSLVIVAFASTMDISAMVETIAGITVMKEDVVS